MKKYLFFIIVVSIFAFLSSCATTYKAYNRNIPNDETCTIRIPDNFTVVRFNDSRVRWKTSIWYFPLISYKKEVEVKIPAGENTLIVNYFWRQDTGYQVHTRRADGIEVKYDFQAGESYAFFPIISEDRIAIFVRKL